MNRFGKLALAALLPVAFATGCDDWLTGPGINDDPNRPTEANRELLLVGVTANQTALWTGALARVASMWTQQMAGTDRQYITLDRYGVTEDDFTSEFSAVYSSGGLLDIRQVQQESRAAGDMRFLGVAQVWEAYMMGMAASVWGDIPYEQAADSLIATPALTPQAQVYAMVQAKLDSAITNLAGSGIGPGSSDLIYGGNAQRWTRAAWSLKARFYMHWAQPQLAGAPIANTACGGNCLTRARDAAMNGIDSPAGDMRSYQSATPGEQNMWHQFMFIERSGYISGGAFLIDSLLTPRNDPRLAEFFAPNAQGVIRGSRPGGAGGTGAGAAQLSLTRGAAGFRQPLITWAETRLILAEAQYLLGQQNDARTTLNTYLAAAGLPQVGGGVTGTALLQSIYEELYIALFQNVEAMNMYQRSCYPNVAPAAGGAIPGRLFYGTDERNANPNIPDTSAQPVRNANDPPGGTLFGPAVCRGQPG